MKSYISKLGKPCIMELSFPSLPDEDIKIGQWIVLWDEIPIRKIGSYIYEVYPEASIEQIETFEEKLEKTRKALIDFVNRRDSRNFILPEFLDDITYDSKRYVKTRKGSRKVNPWESPKFFG